MTTQERIQLLAEACQSHDIASFLGAVTEDTLSAWVTAELGHADALDVFHPHGNLLSTAYAPEHILHVVSGNTPHAAFQSVLRGLLVGSNNIVKLPSFGLPDLQRWITSLPSALISLVTCCPELSKEIWQDADVVIAIGSDQTITGVHSRLLPHQIFIPHGHKVSIGIVTDDFKNAARLAARDCSVFNQRGCLSPHAIYVQGNVRQFAEFLAEEMESFAVENPPTELSLSEAGAVRNLRETSRFISANDNTTGLWHSANNLDWTVILEPNAELKLSCLNRCIYVKPLPERISVETLGKQSQHLSTIAIHPFDQQSAQKLLDSPAHRICPLGKSQQPELFWHHDGFAPLASLIKWKDIG